MEGLSEVEKASIRFKFSGRLKLWLYRVAKEYRAWKRERYLNRLDIVKLKVTPEIVKDYFAKTVRLYNEGEYEIREGLPKNEEEKRRWLIMNGGEELK